jgi:alkylation response protein AidB-like acyl-CoA dehydrogenase
MFELSEASRMIRQLTHDFALKEIRPVAADFDEREEFPWDVARKGAAIGLAGGAWGGPGLDGSSLDGPDVEGDPGVTNLVMAEELAWGCAGFATGMLANGLAATAINVIGTPQQRDRFLPLCTPHDGRLRLGALALTEPESGSDAGALQTRAVRDGDDYVLNGTKRFITCGGIADLTIVFATEEPGTGFNGVSAFAVPKDTAGFSQGQKWRKMGIRASHTADLNLDDVRLPADHRLGESDPDFRSAGSGALGTLMATRPWIGSMAVGLSRAAFEYAAAYARDRQAFGKPIIVNQGVSFMLADMDIAIDAARLLCWRAGDLIARGLPNTLEEASKAKCFAADSAMKTTTDAVQIAGGMGFMRDTPLEKWMRDAKIFQIYEGTSQIQREVIGRNIAARAF